MNTSAKCPRPCTDPVGDENKVVGKIIRSGVKTLVKWWKVVYNGDVVKRGIRGVRLMFMGTYYNSIDSKNRLIVPSKHRDQLAGKCVLTKGLDTCLYIYSVPDWEKQMEKIAELPESDPKIRAFIRHYFGNATVCEFDKQGRIVIPQNLIDYAKISKDLVTMGAMRKVEIWSREVWETPENEGKLDSQEYAEALRQYNF